MLGRQQGLVCPCPRNPARRLAPVTCTRAHAVPLPGRAAARPASESLGRTSLPTTSGLYLEVLPWPWAAPSHPPGPGLSVTTSPS